MAVVHLFFVDSQFTKYVKNELFGFIEFLCKFPFSTYDYLKKITNAIYSEYRRLAGSLHGLQFFVIHGNTVFLNYTVVVPLEQSPGTAKIHRNSDTSVRRQQESDLSVHELNWMQMLRKQRSNG